LKSIDHTRRIAVTPSTPSPLPRRVFFAFIGIAAIAMIAAFALTFITGWVPPRESAAIVLPLYFAVLLSVLSLSFVVSGNTLMHHHRTGTIQRDTDPVSFWWIVGVQVAIAAILLVVGCVQWAGLYD
jgi:hypothetical protein